MANLTGQLDLRNLLNLDRADQVFQELLRQVAAQNLELVELRAQVNQCATKEMVHTVGKALQDNIGRVDMRCSVIDKSLDVPANQDKLSIGDVVGRLSMIVNELSQIISTKADAHNLKEFQISTLEKLQLSVDKIYEELAPKTYVEAIEDNQQELSHQLNATSELLQTKADRSQLTSIESTCRKLSRFQSHVETSQVQIENLNNQALNTKNILSDHEKQFHDINEVIQQQGNELKLKSNMDDLVKLKRETVALGNAFSNNAKEAQRIQTEHEKTLKESREDLLQLSTEVKALDVSTSTQLSQLQDVINILPRQEIINDLMPRSEFLQEVSRLNGFIDRKAGLKGFMSLLDRVDTCENVQTKHEKEISIAIRFVEWFSHKGEAYEHNLRAIDTHLGSLTTGRLY